MGRGLKRPAMMKRGQKFVTKHVGTDRAMTIMALRRAVGQTLRHIVELNHRSELHVMLVAYDPRPQNPSLTFFGSQDIIRAALRSTLKDEICTESLPKQLLKTTLRVPVFSPRNTSELQELVEKEQEENLLTHFFYSEMQRCTFPMHFFKPKFNDSWIPRKDVAFWPPDLEVHTLHEANFGKKRDGTRCADKTQALLYILDYLKKYYTDVMLRALQLHLIKEQDGFRYVNDYGVVPVLVESAKKTVEHELCTRLFVSWILNPLRPIFEKDEKQGASRLGSAKLHEMSDEDVEESAADDDYAEEPLPYDIDICGEDEVIEEEIIPTSSSQMQYQTQVQNFRSQKGPQRIVVNYNRAPLYSNNIVRRQVPSSGVRFIRVPCSQVLGADAISFANSRKRQAYSNPTVYAPKIVKYGDPPDLHFNSRVLSHEEVVSTSDDYALDAEYSIAQDEPTGFGNRHVYK